MKRISLVFIASALILGLQGCAKSYITNTWKVDKYERNGNDETQSFQQVLFIDYSLTLHDNGDYVEYARPLTIPVTKTGAWRFLEGRKKIELVEDGSGDTRVFHVNKLTSNQLVVTYYTSDTHKYYLSPK